MTNEDKRRHYRVDTLNLLNYECLDEDGNMIARGMGRTLNVSESGILLETHVSLDSPSLITLTIGFEEDLIEIKGKVVYSKPGEAGRFESGIQFFEKDEKTETLLKFYIEAFQNL